MDLLLLYAVAELILSLHISLSNLLVLWVYVRTRSVRTVTNTYIFSLALTDFLSGAFGIPITVWSVLSRQPHNYLGCLSVHLILCVLCTVSTFHMLAIALDKYVTICCTDRVFNSRHGRAIFLITTSWIAGTAIAILPLFGVFNMSRREEFSGECHFTEVMDYRYLVWVIFFGTILIPTAFIVFCYTSIYSRIRKEEAQVKCLLNRNERERRMLGRRKLIRILLILVFTYGVCWYPLYMINSIDLYFPSLHSTPAITLSTVVLSHMSCAVNPLIYAYGMPGFKKALRSFFRLTPESNKFSCYHSTAIGQPKNRTFSITPGNGVVRRESNSYNRKISVPTPTTRRSIKRNRRKTIDIRL